MAKNNIPTYEEYKKATYFARIKYKYGIIVLILCWICLLFIIYYLITNGKSLATNPLMYACQNANVDLECKCYDSKLESRVNFYVNSTSMWTENLHENKLDLNFSDDFWENLKIKK